MYPVQEQRHRHGVGLGFEEFSKRFDDICQQHLAQGKARAFAFIFYDFEDRAIRGILKDEGVFAELDRLSGDRMTIFYLNASTRHGVKSFNEQFLSALGVVEPVSLPCVVFFKVKDEEIREVDVAILDHANLIHGFRELYGAIEHYLGNQTLDGASESRAIRWLKKGGIFVALNALREFFRARYGV